MLADSGNVIDSAQQRNAAGPPRIEVVVGSAGPSSAGGSIGGVSETGAWQAADTSSVPWHKVLRFRVFLFVFLLVSIPGLTWDFLRPPHYRAVATLLTEQPPVDRAGRANQQSETQHMAIQRRLLLAPDLLAETLRRAATETALTVATSDDLAPMLQVSPLPDTSLVELSAAGTDRDQLAPLVNAWAAGYLDSRQQALQAEIGDTLDALRAEYEAFGITIEEQTRGLERFRSQHDIVTLERSGNEALARLAALQRELNRARDEYVEAEARLAATEAAVLRGDPIVPASEQGAISSLELQVAELDAKLIDLNKRFLPFFLENHPEHRIIPSQIQALELQIARKLAQGREMVLSERRQEVEQSRRRVEVLEDELVEHKEVAKRFTASFARYQELQDNLTALQELRKQTGARLVELEARKLEKYPPVKIIGAAHRPAYPFEPPYWRDALVIMVAALAAGLAAVWLTEFLTRRPRSEAEPRFTGVRVVAADPAAAMAHGESALALRYAEPVSAIPSPEPVGPPHGLPASPRRTLIPAEVESLWNLAPSNTRRLMALLLSGLTLDECASLSAEDFDLANDRVRVPGPSAREIDLTPAAAELFLTTEPRPLWSEATASETPVSLSNGISLLAHDAGLSRPDEVDGNALRDTYLAYLVGQGARLTELEQRVGAMSAKDLMRFIGFAPAGQAKPLSEIETTYPLLAGLQKSGSAAH